MKRTSTALLLTLALATPAMAQDSISKVNGSVQANAGQTYGDLETVNGSINIEDNATTRQASTVNGGISVGNGAKTAGLETVNGGIKAGGKVQVDGDVETVNGGIGLVGTDVGGGIETVSGDITVGVDSHVKGGIKVEKPKGNFNFHANKRPPRIVIGPNAVVEGPLVFEREVVLYVHASAKTGAITGATAKRFDTATAPQD